MKRITAVLLVALMVLAVVPFAAIPAAAETEPAGTSTTRIYAAIDEATEPAYAEDPNDSCFGVAINVSLDTSFGEIGFASYKAIVTWDPTKLALLRDEDADIPGYYNEDIYQEGLDVIPAANFTFNPENLAEGKAILVDASSANFSKSIKENKVTKKVPYTEGTLMVLDFYPLTADACDTDITVTTEMFSSATGDYNGLNGNPRKPEQWANGGVEVTTIPLNGGHTHDYTTENGGSIVVTPPTCVEDGFTTYTCACGDAYVGDTVPATGAHTYVDVVTPPTKTTQGYTTHTCSVCNHSYIDTYVDPYIFGEGDWVDSWTLVDGTDKGTWQQNSIGDFSYKYAMEVEDDVLKVGIQYIGNMSGTAASYGNGNGTNVRLWLHDPESGYVAYNYFLDVAYDGTSYQSRLFKNSNPAGNTGAALYAYDAVKPYDVNTLVTATGWDVEILLPLDEIGLASGCEAIVCVSDKSTGTNYCLYNDVCNAPAGTWNSEGAALKHSWFGWADTWFTASKTGIWSNTAATFDYDYATMVDKDNVYVGVKYKGTLSGTTEAFGNGNGTNVRIWFFDKDAGYTTYTYFADISYNGLSFVNRFLKNNNPTGNTAAVVHAYGAESPITVKTVIGTESSIIYYVIPKSELNITGLNTEMLITLGDKSTGAFCSLNSGAFSNPYAAWNSAESIVYGATVDGVDQGAWQSGTAGDFTYDVVAGLTADKAYIGAIYNGVTLNGTAAAFGNGKGTNFRFWIRSTDDEPTVYTYFIDVSYKDGEFDSFLKKNTSLTSNAATTVYDYGTEKPYTVTIDDSYEGAKVKVELTIDKALIGVDKSFEVISTVSNKNDAGNTALYYSDKCLTPYSAWNDEGAIVYPRSAAIPAFFTEIAVPQYATKENVAVGKYVSGAIEGTGYCGALDDGIVPSGGNYNTGAAASWNGLRPANNILFDLGSAYNIGSFRIHVWPAGNSGISNKYDVKFSASNDGYTWLEVGTIVIDEPANTNPKWYELKFDNFLNARYFKVNATGGWSFLSEIEAYTYEAVKEVANIKNYNAYGWGAPTIGEANSYPIVMGFGEGKTCTTAIGGNWFTWWYKIKAAWDVEQQVFVVNAVDGNGGTAYAGWTLAKNEVMLACYSGSLYAADRDNFKNVVVGDKLYFYGIDFANQASSNGIEAKFSINAPVGDDYYKVPKFTKIEATHSYTYSTTSVNIISSALGSTLGAVKDKTHAWWNFAVVEWDATAGCYKVASKINYNASGDFRSTEIKPYAFLIGAHNDSSSTAAIVNADVGQKVYLYGADPMTFTLDQALTDVYVTIGDVDPDAATAPYKAPIIPVLTVAGFAGGDIAIIPQINGLTTVDDVASYIRSVEIGNDTDYNYYNMIVVDANNKVTATNFTLGRPAGLKGATVIPDGGYVLLVNAGSSFANEFKTILVGDDINLYGAELDTLEASVPTEGGVALTGVMFSHVHVHNYQTVVHEPTCTEDGYTTYGCICGDSTVVEGSTVPALGHDYTVSGTCPWKVQTCSRGDSVINTPFNPEATSNDILISHVNAYSWGAYNEIIINRVGGNAQTVLGYQLTWWREFVISSVDGQYVVTGYTPSGTNKSAVVPEGGFIIYVFSNDAASFAASGNVAVGDIAIVEGVNEKANTVASAVAVGKVRFLTPGHNYTTTVHAPTTDAEGYTNHTCEWCGDTYDDAFVDKTPVIISLGAKINTEKVAIRFGATYNKSTIYGDVASMGMLVTAKTKLGDAALDFDYKATGVYGGLVADVKASAIDADSFISGKSFSEYDTFNFTVTVLGLAGHEDFVLVARPYVEYEDGTIVYGEQIERSYNEIASLVLA